MSKSNPEIDNITSRLSKSFSEINEFQQRVSKSELELDTIQSKSNEELDFAQSTSSVGDILEKHDTKLQRPRSCESLNLSSWSVASRISSQTTSSSETGSESAYNPSTLSSTTSSSNTPSSTSERRSSARSDKKEDHQQQPLTITTLMGGRGYIQWRSTHVEKHKTSHLAQINNSDAYLVIWDHRLKS
jgi:Rho guanine nucleotide exchange factor 10